MDEHEKNDDFWHELFSFLSLVVVLIALVVVVWIWLG